MEMCYICFATNVFVAFMFVLCSMKTTLEAALCKEVNNFLAFLCTKAAMLSARLSHRNSVRLSVHPSHGWISQKRCKIELPNFLLRLLGRL